MALSKVRLGDYLKIYRENCGKSNLTCWDVSGVNKDKEFFEPAKQVGEDTSNYKIVPPDYFACNLMHIGRDVVLPIALNRTRKPKYVSPAYRVQVGNHDYFIDLLFFHRGLSCLAAFELKIGEFKPEYVGKMNLYLEALDRDVKKDNENPSVGVILCASKDDEVVEYALSRSLSPTLVSEYRLKLIDKKLLQRKLKEYVEMAENSLEEPDN